MKLVFIILALLASNINAANIKSLNHVNSFKDSESFEKIYYDRVLDLNNKIVNLYKLHEDIHESIIYYQTYFAEQTIKLQNMLDQVKNKTSYKSL